MSEYDDIINMPHHVSKKHPQMSILARAAQFGAFAALSGYEDAIDETGRLTDNMINISEDEAYMIDNVLYEIQMHIDEKPEVKICCFVPDNRKSGGSYRNIRGNIKKIDMTERKILLTDETVIDITKISSIEMLHPQQY